MTLICNRSQVTGQAVFTLFTYTLKMERNLFMCTYIYIYMVCVYIYICLYIYIPNDPFEDVIYIYI